MPMKSVLTITRALADENRLRALLVLDGRELCVCQLIEFLELAPSTVSKHMSILRQAGLVDGQKRGRWMCYRLANENNSSAVKDVISWLKRALSEDPLTHKDIRRIQKIIKMDREILCYHQNNRRRPCKNKKAIDSFYLSHGSREVNRKIPIKKS